MLVYLPFIKNRMILKYKVTLLVLKLLNESYIFQCSFCDKLQLKKSIFFSFLKTGSCTPKVMVNVIKIERKQFRGLHGFIVQRTMN